MGYINGLFGKEYYPVSSDFKKIHEMRTDDEKMFDLYNPALSGALNEMIQRHDFTEEDLAESELVIYDGGIMLKRGKDKWEIMM